MSRRTLVLIALFTAGIPALCQQLSQPSQAQMQAACLAALPPAPIPPQYPSRSPFPIIDLKLRQMGIDPDALRDAQYQAALHRYQTALQAYQQKRNACFFVPMAAAPQPLPTPATSAPSVAPMPPQIIPTFPQVTPQPMPAIQSPAQTQTPSTVKPQ